MDKALQRILYIEDEKALGQIVTESLQSRYNVEWVEDGALVIKAFNSFNPDLCILDVMLPNVDGFTLGKLINQLQPEIPILYVSARTEIEDVLEGFKAGGLDYIRKPFSMKELEIRVESLLQRKRDTKPESRQLRIGDYSFDLFTYELKHNDKNFTLTHKEAELLTLLEQSRNDIIERKTILLKIWGDDSFFHSRRLDVYVRKLRSYLQYDDKVNLITLRGLGYRFSVEQ